VGHEAQIQWRQHSLVVAAVQIPAVAVAHPSLLPSGDNAWPRGYPEVAQPKPSNRWWRVSYEQIQCHGLALVRQQAEYMALTPHHNVEAKTAA
jgi:hypothetical protein